MKSFWENTGGKSFDFNDCKRVLILHCADLDFLHINGSGDHFGGSYLIHLYENDLRSSSPLFRFSIGEHTLALFDFRSKSACSSEDGNFITYHHGYERRPEICR
jgi:hypothetical protein